MNARYELDKLARDILAEGHDTQAEFAQALVDAIVERFGDRLEGGAS